MTSYIDEFNSRLNSAKDSFKQESEEQLNKFAIYLEKLEAKTISPEDKLIKAFSKKLEIEYNLKNFIEKYYPKSEEVFINDLVCYTVETAIFFNLMVHSLGETSKGLKSMYNEFSKKYSPQKRFP